MTPKEKATELVNKYTFLLNVDLPITKSKQCALIAVDEVIDAIDWHEFETPNKELNYWLDVRKEIVNL